MQHRGASITRGLQLDPAALLLSLGSSELLFVLIVGPPTPGSSRRWLDSYSGHLMPGDQSWLLALEMIVFQRGCGDQQSQDAITSKIFEDCTVVTQLDNDKGRTQWFPHNCCHCLPDTGARHSALSGAHIHYSEA